MKTEKQGTFGDILNNHQVTDFTNNGKCSGCGSCCGKMLYLSEKEIKDIRYYIKRKNIKETTRILNVFADKPMLDMVCPFLSERETDRCNIYEVRPEICRIFKCDNTKVFQTFEEMLTFMDNRELINMQETFFPK